MKKNNMKIILYCSRCKYMKRLNTKQSEDFAMTLIGEVNCAKCNHRHKFTSFSDEIGYKIWYNKKKEFRIERRKKK